MNLARRRALQSLKSGMIELASVLLASLHLLATICLSICMIPIVPLGFAARCAQIAWTAGWRGAGSFWDKQK